MLPWWLSSVTEHPNAGTRDTRKAEEEEEKGKGERERVNGHQCEQQQQKSIHKGETHHSGNGNTNHVQLEDLATLVDHHHLQGVVEERERERDRPPTLVLPVPIRLES